MPVECPFCRSPVDNRAVVCPRCTSDLRYPERAVAPRPRTPQERWQRTQSRAQGVSGELFIRLLFIAPLAVLIGLPLLPVVVIVAGIILLWAVVAHGLGAESRGTTSAPSAAEPKVRSGNGVQWTPGRYSKRSPHVCPHCQRGRTRAGGSCPHCGFGS